MASITLQNFQVKTYVNELFRNKEPWQIVAITTSTVLATVWLYEYLAQETGEFQNFNTFAVFFF